MSDVIHWNRGTAFSAACGADIPNQTTTDTIYRTTCVACVKAAQSYPLFSSVATDRLTQLQSQPVARQWHMDAWLQGGCMACGGNERPTGHEMICDPCFDRHVDTQGSTLLFDARGAIQAAGHSPKLNPRPAPAPSKQEPPRKTLSVTIDVKNIDTVKDAITARNTLLTRLSDFLANLPSGSLDRARNLECMQLRREIADAIVPADKKRK